MTCANSMVSDQPAHTCRLIWNLAVCISSNELSDCIWVYWPFPHYFTNTKLTNWHYCCEKPGTGTKSGYLLKQCVAFPHMNQTRFKSIAIRDNRDLSLCWIHMLLYMLCSIWLLTWCIISQKDRWNNNRMMQSEATIFFSIPSQSPRWEVW